MRKITPFLVILIFLGFNNNIKAQEIIEELYKSTENKEIISSPQELKQRKANGAKANIIWTGSISYSWHIPGNWSTGNVPTENDNVSIPDGVPHPPIISGTAYCNNLYLNTNASLSQYAGTFLYCYGTFDAGFGQFTMYGSSYLYFRGSANNIWYDDNQNDTYSNIRVDKTLPTATISMHDDITCSGTFEIREGTFEMSNDLTLTVTNTGSNAFEVEDGGMLDFYATGNNTININGGIVFRDGSDTYFVGNNVIYVGENILIENNTINYISMAFVIMNGSGDQIIQILDVDSRIHTLRIDKPSGICFIAEDLNTVIINIIQGTLSCRDAPGSLTTYDITCAMWQNNVGEAGFDEATGRVIFHGLDFLECSSETFYELEINGQLILTNDDIICAAYDWTSGSVAAYANASFTAYDLLDNAVQGSFWVHPDGEINLTNSGASSSTYVDLKGDLHIFGGTMNITGSLSYWPYQEDASIEMSDGVLNFDCDGILIDDNGFALDDNITGGTIRTSGYFQGNRADFTPTAGTFELYGSSDMTISQSNGSTLYDLNINKSSKEPSASSDKIPILKDKRSGEYIGDGTKSNTISLNSDLVIINNLLINSGILNSNDNDIYIEGDWSNNSGPSGFNETTSTVHFTESALADILTDETFYNLSIEKTIGSFEALELSANKTVNVLNNLNVVDGTLELNNNSTLNIGNDVNILFEAGLNAGGADIGINLSVGGDWNNFNTEYNSFIGYMPGGETITFIGTTHQEITTSASKEDFGNLVIDKPSGQFRPNNSINVKGDLLIADGEWNDNISSLMHYFEGDFEVNASGGFYTAINQNTVVFKTTSDQNIIYDGTTGYFCNIIVDKTNWPTEKTMLEVEGLPPGNGNQIKNPKASTVNLNTGIWMQGSYGLTIDEGTLNLNGQQLFTWENFDINDGGNVIMNEGQIRIVNGGQLNINNGGTLTAHGSLSTNTLITRRSPTGYYEINVNSGGTISAEHATFEYMDWYGVNISMNGIVDPAHAFNYCTFQNVKAATEASSITFNTTQDLSCTGAHFPDNPYCNIYKSTTVGDITMIGATGDFAGPEYELDYNNKVHWTDMDIELDLKVMLEGPYNGTGMNTDLNTQGLIPTDQPYWINGAADWYYTGTETVGSIPANIVDWVLVRIKDAIDAPSSASAPVVAEQAAFLLNNGSIVDLSGSSNLIFSGITYSSGLFPVVWQRNHLGVISSDKMTRIGGIYTWDFTQSGSAYSNSNPGEKHLGSGVYGMYSGDATGNGEISQYDNAYWSTLAGNKNYYQCDFNLNGQVNNIDKNDFWYWNNQTSSQIPGGKSNDK